MPGTGFGSGDSERRSQGRPVGKNQAGSLGLSWARQVVGEYRGGGTELAAQGANGCHQACVCVCGGGGSQPA